MPTSSRTRPGTRAPLAGAALILTALAVWATGSPAAGGLPDHPAQAPRTPPEAYSPERAASAGPAQAAAPSCDRQIIFLAPLPGDGGSQVGAMNDQGWVVGISFDPGPSAAVLWRDTTTPLDLELGGTTLPNGDQTMGWPVDVNEHGVVAVQRTRLNASGSRVLSISSWLWRDGERTRLPGTANRHRAVVESINDHGVAAGFVRGRGAWRPPVPAVWRKGVATRLPLPRDASGFAVENNNHGLVVGYVVRGETATPWWWRLGGRGGPLRELENDNWTTPVDVDDRGRIVGHAPFGVLWRDRDSIPQRIRGPRHHMAAMNDRGDLTGTDGGFRGISDRAWVARTNGRSAWLPSPPTDDPDGWMNTRGWDLTRGVTSVAPQGGVTVGGTAVPWDGPARAVLWTCAQTYLP